MVTCHDLPSDRAVEAAPPAATRFWREMAARELTFGQRQYGDWARECEALDGLIQEVVHDPDKPSTGWAQEISAMALHATRARRARLADLLATHPQWSLPPL
jgi:hypothetical protein